ncbi:hypothetical protein OL229_08895 [Neisseriaceae bacterium JH1-16]|nr:hypothetical protein [Neisseriaceae bacterium JH1-16]
MKQQVSRISVFKSSVSFGFIGYILGFPILVLMHLFANFASRPHYSPLQPSQVIVIPLGIALIVFIFSLIGSVSYNIAARFGFFIEFNTKQSEK